MKCPTCATESPPGKKFCGDCGARLDEDTAAAIQPAAERRQLTVMFCDLVGSTALSERLDPEDLRDVLTLFQDSCRSVLARFDGFIARYMGDGILVYFGYPQAREDDTERAVRAGLAIIETVSGLRPLADVTLETRVGLATGLVVAGDLIGEGASEERAVLGVTPNLAARLQGLAEPNTLVISDDTHGLVTGRFESKDLGTHALKGISAPAQAWRVVRESRAQGRFDAAASRGLLPLVGREHELDTLGKWLRREGSGEHPMALISGDAGMGKSHLLNAFCTGPEGSARHIISCHCSPYHRDSALHPVLRAFEHRLASDGLESFLEGLALPAADMAPVVATFLGLPAADHYPPLDMPPQQLKTAMFKALSSVFERLAGKEPLLVVIEDLQWSDPTTLEFIDFLIGHGTPGAPAVLLTCRAGQEPAWIAGQPMTTIALSPLRDEASLEMIAAVTRGTPLSSDTEKLILEKTDGIPLFVEEFTKMLLEGSDGVTIPASLQDLLMSRLDRLGTAKTVAQLAAAFGRTFRRHDLAAAGKFDENTLHQAINRLIEAEMVFPLGQDPESDFEFKHALVRDVAYQSLLKQTRRSHHQAIALVLEPRVGQSADAPPEVVAHHFFEGGIPEMAAGYWLNAGRRANDRSASIEAVNHLTQGLAAIGPTPDSALRTERETALHIALVAALRILDRYDEALKSLDSAQALAIRRDSTQDLGLIHYHRGNILFPLGDVDGCLREHEKARQCAHLSGSAEIEARALGGLGDAYYQRGWMRTAHARFDDCIALCRQHGFRAIEVANLGIRGHTRLYLNGHGEARDLCREAADAARKIGNPRAEMVARGSCLAKILWDMALLDEARTELEQGLDLARQLGAGRYEPLYLQHLAKVLALQGDRNQAIRLAESALEKSRATGLGFAGPMVLGSLALVADDRPTRLKALEEGETLLRRPCVSHNHLWFYRDAIEVSLDMGDWAGAERFATALEEFTNREPLPWAQFFISRGRTLAAVGGGENTSETGALLDALLVEAEQTGLAIALPALAQARASC
jgi:class 3 adenylate cyclase/tetratricopeptide (TPR) repeat protein